MLGNLAMYKRPASSATLAFGLGTPSEPPGAISMRPVLPFWPQHCRGPRPQRAASLLQGTDSVKAAAAMFYSAVQELSFILQS